MRLGKIAVVRTSEPVAYLGGVLYELGLIDMPTLNETLHEVASAKRLHGDVLVERGAITRERLDEGLAEQTFRKVHHLFTLSDDTQWSFRDDVDELANARDEDRPFVDTWKAIWRGLRDQPPAPHVRRTLAKVQGEIHLRDLSAVRRFGFSPEELAVCERLHAQAATPERVVTTSRLSVDRTTSLIYLLALARCIARVQQRPLGPVDLGAAGVRELAARIDAEDAHTALGVRADAGVEAARAAYLRLARLWHPDKLPADLAEVRAECSHIFVRLGDAHRAIADTPMLKHADAVLRASGAPPGMAANDSIAPPPSERPTMRDVDAALARKDLATAETMARTLTSAGNDGPSARAVIAWCACGADAGSTADPGAMQRTLAALDKLLTADPECVRALFYRGRILQRLGRTDTAMRDYRKVVRLDPRHVDAQREVRLYDIRQRSSSADSPAPVVPADPPPSGGGTSVRSGLRRLLARVAGK